MYVRKKTIEFLLNFQLIFLYIFLGVEEIESICLDIDDLVLVLVLFLRNDSFFLLIFIDQQFIVDICGAIRAFIISLLARLIGQTGWTRLVRLDRLIQLAIGAIGTYLTVQIILVNSSLDGRCNDNVVGLFVDRFNMS